MRDSGLEIGNSGNARIQNLEFPGANVLCFIQTTAHIPANDHWLSEEERKISTRFHVPKRRTDWRLGRWTAKQAICAFHVNSPFVLSSLEIRTAGDGAPEAFYEGNPVAVSISISHSRDRSLCAVAGQNTVVGCDLEWIETREEKFAADYFTMEEISIVMQAPSNRELAETLIWSAKECTLKILRKGLTRDTRSVLIQADISERGEVWKRWTGRCLESGRLFNGLWRASDGFVFTVGSS